MEEGSQKFLDKEGKPIKDLLAFKNFNHLFSRKKLTYGQRAADALTGFAGSWRFIIFFFILISFWVSINFYFFARFKLGAFDPYPFILLNLVLSCLAAIQAPIILMSQNRESERGRIRTEYDYAVNRKAEKEVREINNRLDKIERLLKK